MSEPIPVLSYGGPTQPERMGDGLEMVRRGIVIELIAIALQFAFSTNYPLVGFGVSFMLLRRIAGVVAVWNVTTAYAVREPLELARWCARIVALLLVPVQAALMILRSRAVVGTSRNIASPSWNAWNFNISSVALILAGALAICFFSYLAALLRVLGMKNLAKQGAILGLMVGVTMMMPWVVLRYFNSAASPFYQEFMVTYFCWHAAVVVWEIVFLAILLAKLWVR